MASETVDEHVRRYERRRPEIENAARGLAQMLGELIADADVSCLSVDARAKEVGSFRKKCQKTNPDGTPRYADPSAEITDTLAARVITYLPEAVDRVCEIVRREFDVVHETDKGAETRARGLFGYSSRHFEVRLGQHRRGLVEYRTFGGQMFEIQVRTAVQHAWAEFEHDLRYKGEIPAGREAEVNRRFLLAAALIEMADNEFAEIDRLFGDLARSAPAPEAAREATPSRDSITAAAAKVSPLDGSSLTAYLSRRYPDAPRSKADHYEWMLGLLADLDLTSVEGLEGALSAVRPRLVADAMGYELPAGQVRRLDDDLLVALGTRYFNASTYGTTNESNRAGLLRHRLDKLSKAGVPVG